MAKRTRTNSNGTTKGSEEPSAAQPVMVVNGSKGAGRDTHEPDVVAVAHQRAMVLQRPLPPEQPELAGTLDEVLQTPALAWPVVAFGASAGGLQAFREVLENLPPDTGMAFVLITHLAPDHKSFMSEILAKHTAMPVLPIENGIQPEPNRLYVLQPNENATLKGGQFHVKTRPSSKGPNMPINLFFRSLAADQKNHAISVVLSGADSDGAAGAKAVKGEGGISLVQSPETAQHSSMPRNSIAFDHVDLVLAPGELASELGRIARQFASAGVQLMEEGPTTQELEDHFGKILQMLRNLAGIEFKLYKPQTLRRRIARRMVLLRMDSLGEYLNYLAIRADELKILHEEMLINVTRFFRDTDFWHSFQTSALPALFQDRPVEKPLRIWCAGCASGEEAYTLAICVLEYLSSNGLDTPIQVFGTDASESSIDMARSAIYPDTLATELSADRMRRFFVKVDRGYQVSKRVRDCCIFARQNLSNDPPFSHIDILSCRNVLIYFNQILQRQIMMTFHYALEPAGYMLLGMSETLREYGSMFGTADRKHRIYTKIGQSVGGSFDLPRYFVRTPAPALSLVKDSYNWQDIDLQRAADRIVLARFSPPGLIVDQDLNVLQVRGQTAPFIELPTGTVTWNLLRILREEIATQIRQGLQHAVKENVPASIAPVHFNGGGIQRDLQIDILPISDSTLPTRCFMLIFQAAGEAKSPTLPAALTTAALTEDEKDALSAQLRLDLSTTRFHLQSLIEERDAHNQELVSANEEIQSANEELQSSNEELETTKEELQSANEELQTVNEELQQRNLVLTQTGNDLTNLLSSVNIPLLMLTNDLKVRQFTPPMQRLLNVRTADIGRSISEIRLQLSIEDIEPILLDVMETLGTREVEVQDREGRWNLLRVRPYRTSENHIEGLVVVLVDIDQLRRSQQELIESRDFVSTVVESVPVPIVVLHKDCRILSNNSAFRELTGMPTKDLKGRSLPDLVGNLWGLDGFVTKLNVLADAPDGETFEFEHESTTTRRKILLIKGLAVLSDGDRVILLVMEDITARREAEVVLERQKLALEQEVVTAAHALDRTQEELRGLTAHLFTVQEEERQRVSRELHDDVSQRLSFVELMLKDLVNEEHSEEEKRQMSSVREHIQSLNDDVRSISHRLHPSILDDLGISTALKALVTEFGEREGMPATFVSQDVPEMQSQPATTAMYRITQEALRNVAKHAGKTHVKVLLSGKGTSLHLEVLDLGLGFDQDSDLRPDGLGLISMKERARLAHGSFALQSELGRGTKVIVEIPLESHA